MESEDSSQGYKGATKERGKGPRPQHSLRPPSQRRARMLEDQTGRLRASQGERIIEVEGKEVSGDLL